MKLSAAVDLAPIRAKAVDLIDLTFARRLEPSPMSAMWAEKVRRAERELADPHGPCTDPLFAEEAALRGIGVLDLARSILAKAEAETARIMAIELERQRLKARVAAAPDQHAIRAILEEIA